MAGLITGRRCWKKRRRKHRGSRLSCRLLKEAGGRSAVWAPEFTFSLYPEQSGGCKGREEVM